MLTDQFNRQFNYLRLSITDVCNFSCNYCLPDGYQCTTPRNFLTPNEIATLVSAFAQLGIKKIRLTGGEPALRKDLTDIIALCKQTTGIEQVAITTNGFNLINHVEQWQQAGLDAINISADSLDTRLFHSITGHNKLPKILAGVERAQILGFQKIKLNAVLLKQFNYRQLNDYLAWIQRRKVTVRFIELMEVGNNKRFFKDNHVSGELIKQQLLNSGWQQKIRHQLAGPAQEFYHPDYQGNIGLIMPYSDDFCRTCNRLRISALGKLHLCLFTEQGHNLRAWLTAGDIEGTKQAISQALKLKVASHYLQQHQVGATQHLAMIGG